MHPKNGAIPGLVGMRVKVGQVLLDDTSHGTRAGQVAPEGQVRIPHARIARVPSGLRALAAAAVAVQLAGQVNQVGVPQTRLVGVPQVGQGENLVPEDPLASGKILVAHQFLILTTRFLVE